MDFQNFWFSSGATGGGGGGDPGDPIGQSLRFRGGQRLFNNSFPNNHNPNSTLSFWIKRGELGTLQTLGCIDNGVNNLFGRFQTGDTYTIITPGGTGGTSTRVFRDPSAWYHFVINNDNCWINGELQSNFTAPLLEGIQNNNRFNIGLYGANLSQHFDGYFADFYYIDGQALEPTAFGRFNANGVWVPREVDFASANLSNNVTVSTGGFAAGTNLIFDGNPDTGAVADTADAVVTFAPVNVPVNGDIVLRLGSDNVNATITWNGQTYNWTAGGGTFQTAFSGVTGTINGVTPLVITPAAGEVVVWNEIQVNGITLLDGGGYGNNGFHLDFADPDNVGLDTSGNGNNFTATGFDTAPIGIFSNDLTTNTSFSEANPPSQAFDNSTESFCLANGAGGTNTTITFAPTTAIALTSLQVFCPGFTDQTITFGGQTTNLTPATTWVDINIGTATEISSTSPLVLTRLTAGESARLIGIRINGTTVLVDNTGTDYDSMQDSPTQNFCTFNPLVPNSGSWNNANLEYVCPTPDSTTSSTIAFNTNDNVDYYAEFQITDLRNQVFVGVGNANSDNWSSQDARGIGNTVVYQSSPGAVFQNGVNVGANANFGAGDIVSCRFTAATNTVSFAVNGNVQPTTSTVPAGATLTFIASDNTGGGGGSQITINCGQQPDQAPAGFSALQTQNLPAAPIANGRDHFQAITGPGQGLGTWSEPNTNSINSPVDITNATSGPFYTLPVTPANQRNWIHDFGFPQASVTHTHLATRTGLTYALSEDGTNWTVVDNNYTVTANVEITSTAAENGGNNVRYVRLYHPTTAWGIGLSAASGGTPILQAAQATFDNGLWWIKDRVNDDTQHQLVDSVRGGNLALPLPPGNAETAYTAPAGDSVAWCWNVNGDAAANGDGSIASQVAANTTAGFSIVTYTGNGGGNAATIGHGLGAIPEFMLVKRTDATAQWSVYHVSIGNQRRLILNEPDAQANPDSIYWDNTTPTTQVFSVGSVSNPNPAAPFVAYCWAPIPGYSAFGSYTGNSSTDGPFIYTGFRPAFVMFKKTDGSANWEIFDTTRSPTNPLNTPLYANRESREPNPDPLTAIDFLSNGFKQRNGQSNSNQGTFIYAAFAENPFQSPVTAR